MTEDIIVTTEPVITKNNKKNRHKVALPGLGKNIVDFADEIGEILNKQNYLFYNSAAKTFVEVSKVHVSKQYNEEDKSYVGLSVVDATRFASLVEHFIDVGVWIYDKKADSTVFKSKTMSIKDAAMVLSIKPFIEQMQKIDRILSCQIPILCGDKLTLPKLGYDKRFETWTDFNSPVLRKDMSLEEAKKILFELYSETNHKDAQDITNTLASLLTPFLRGIYPTFNTLVPGFMHIGNRAGLGKDTCAAVTGIVNFNTDIEYPSITSESSKADDAELNKVFLAAFKSGNRYMHFPNNKGHIDSVALESLITALVWSCRALHTNDTPEFQNDMFISLSGNKPLTYTEDFARRFIFIRHFCDIENIQNKKYKNKEYRTYIRQSRAEILSAMYTLVRSWFDAGMPRGSDYSSFQDWSAICGGILIHCGLGDPTTEQAEVIASIGTDEESDISEFVSKMYTLMSKTTKAESWLTYVELRQILSQNPDIPFHVGENMMLSQKEQRKLPSALTKYSGRIFGGIRLETDDDTKRAARRKYRFVLAKKKNINIDLAKNFFIKKESKKDDI